MPDQADGFGMADAVKSLRSDVESLKERNVPRSELEMRWRHDDERARSLKDAVERLADKVETLVEGNIPARLDRVEKTLEATQNQIADMPGKILKNVAAVMSFIAVVAGLIAWGVAHIH